MSLISQEIKRIIAYAFLAVFDVLVYVAMGIALMSYDDKHDDSQSDYGSWESMTDFDKCASVFMTVWNVINVLALVYISYSVYKRMKFRIQLNSN
ncbi:hypothetical protein MON38_06995 [Hymenobacter sp. DH14]|uniref:Uncharacterized protein n=1 Tax=Hymenobacter cyanobacteriorum TaxID=2926463 RepID=A0A9X2AET9_9BACT|nr:hypothetical protein [Hymenobacter cyanobacteriorum]MCI1187162.1 hypothetical protein [Hymenobacter cyanobacteriorum]